MYSPSFAFVAAFSLARDARSRAASAVDETGLDEAGLDSVLASDRVASRRFSAFLGALVRDGSSPAPAFVRPSPPAVSR